MAWTSGSASNMVTLLQALETFLSANGWTVLRSETFQNVDQSMIPNTGRDPGDEYSTTADGGVDEYRIVMQGPGFTGAQPPVFGIETRRFSTYNYSYWVIASAVGDNGSGPVWGLPGVPATVRAATAYTLWNSSMNYWFTEDGGAVCGVVQVAGTFFHFYAGHYLPYATPGEIAQPAVYGGSCRLNTIRPYTDNTELSCLGTDRASGRATAAIWGGGNVPLIPTNHGGSSTSDFYYESDRTYLELATMPDGDLVLYPITLINKFYGCYGELSLLYRAPVTDVSPGSTVTVGGVQYLITNNGPYDGEYNRFAVRLG